MTRNRTLLLSGAAALGLVAQGCPKGHGNGGDGGNVNLDTACQSLAEAKQNPNCQFNVGSQPTSLCDPTNKSAPQCPADQPVPAGQSCGYLIQQLESNWWQINIPTLPPRPILTVVAEYCAPSTQVNLNINVLGPDGVTGLLGGNATAAPGDPTPPPVTVVARLAGQGPYFVQVQADTSESDPGTSPVETYYPYKIYAYVVSDSNLNWPDNTANLATPMCPGACQSGTCCTPNGVTAATSCGATSNAWTEQTGAISVTGDVNWFTFDVPAYTAPPRQIAYLHIHADALPSPDTNSLQLQYVLYPCPTPLSGSPNACGTPGTQIDTGFAPDPLVAQDLVTARIVTPGRYAIEVQGYDQGTGIPPPGNPLLTYSVSASLYQDQDTNEGTTGNDTASTATPVTLTAGSPTTLTGYISYIPDQDWYAVTVPSGYARIHYKLTPGGMGCFKVPTGDPREMLVMETTSTGSLELRSRRDEDSANVQSELGNFEGIVGLPTGATTILFDFGFRASTGCDDRPYTITFTALAPDPDDASSDVLLNGSGSIALNIPAVGSSASAATPVYIGYGVGFSNSCIGNQSCTTPSESILNCYRTQYAAANNAGLVEWGHNDLDDTSDQDVIQVNFPAGLPAADYLFNLSWQITPGPTQSGGSRPYDAVFDIPFGMGGTGGELSYVSRAQDPWCSGQMTTDAGVVNCPRADPYTFDQSTGAFTLSTSQCICIGSKFVSANPTGFQMTVAGVNRAAWEDSAITVTVGIAAYPPAPFNSGSDGGATVCPQTCGF
jgi:hypothetical protein